MLRYQRLANSQYAYTETTQLVGDIDFTKPEHAYTSGRLSASATSGGPYNYALIFGSAIATGGRMTAQKNILLTSVSTITSYSPANIATATINGVTYYGLLASSVSISTCFGQQASSSGTDYTIYIAPYKITVTYIEATTNTIKTTTMISETEFTKTISRKSSSSSSQYVYCLTVSAGLDTNDIVLNVKFEDYSVETQSNNENDSNSNTSDSDDSEIVAPVPGPVIDGGSCN